jgi:predicted enzyme related to lactoylglutathione lyase
MPEFSSHAPGTLCWPELATTDQKGGVAFYRGLLGWDVVESPIGPTETYSMFNIKGKPVAAGYSMRSEERQHGVPPHWNAYIAVANADDTVMRAEVLGAKILVSPFDVMDAGRMAVLQDPTGASFCIWQSGKHFGAALLRERGALCWTELATTDTKVAETFYTSLFGWTAKLGMGDGMAYTEFSNAGTPQAGMLALTPEMGKMPPFWMPYFQVDDCDAAAAKAQSLGGRVYRAATDLPNVGRFAIVGDPQGAGSALFTPAARA